MNDKHAATPTLETLKRELCPGDGDGNLLPKGVSPKAGYNEHALYSYPTLADGMVRTSVNQLANFMIAMMNGGRFEGAQLLKEETVKEMLSGKGLCWFRAGDYWGHDGSDPGCETEIQFNPRDQGRIHHLRQRRSQPEADQGSSQGQGRERERNGLGGVRPGRSDT